MTDGRSALSIWKIALYVMAIVGVVASILWLRQAMDVDDDRPPVVVSNGSVVIEDMGGNSASGEAGIFQKATSSPAGRTLWAHLHDGKAPKRFRATVTDSSCGAFYSASNLKRAVFAYAGGGASREIYVRVAGPAWGRVLEFDIDAASSQTQPAPERLVIDPVDGRLLSVTLEFNGPWAPRTCSVSDIASSYVALYETQ